VKGVFEKVYILIKKKEKDKGKDGLGRGKGWAKTLAKRIPGISMYFCF